MNVMKILWFAVITERVLISMEDSSVLVSMGSLPDLMASARISTNAGNTVINAHSGVTILRVHSDAFVHSDTLSIWTEDIAWIWMNVPQEVILVDTSART